MNQLSSCAVKPAMPRIFTCPTCGETGHFAKSCPRNPHRNLKGKLFGRWTVIGPAERDTKLLRWLWPCQCSCPARTEKLVPEDALRRDESVSCGCAPKGKPPGSVVHCANCDGRGHHANTCPKPPKTSSEMKTCSVCGPKPATDFSPDNSRCRPCNAAYNRARNAKLTTSKIERPCRACRTPTAHYRAGRPICAGCDNERQAKRRATLKAAGHDTCWRDDLARRYGITETQYQTLLAAQSGRCAICGTTEPNRHKRFSHFHVDHDHETGEIRGLLCDACNLGLGSAQDNPMILRTAAVYLEDPALDLRTNRPGRWPSLPGAAPHSQIQQAERRRLRATYPALDQALSALCPICCARPATDIDHDHETDRIRGVTCNGCNTTLGHFNDDPALLRTAATYLEEHKSQKADG